MLADTCVHVRTDVLKMTIWQTPAGIVDEGGFVLPSWLNFGITLMGPPANGVMHVRPLFTAEPCLHAMYPAILNMAIIYPL